MLNDLWSGLRYWDNLLEKKKKDLIFNRVKMSKIATLIIRPRYLYIKKIKTDYETECLTNSMLNDKIKKFN
jgi:hypothetical protein